MGRDFGREKNYSEETAAIIDEEVKKIIDGAYATAKEILNQNRDKLDKIAAILIERENLWRKNLIESSMVKNNKRLQGIDF